MISTHIEREFSTIPTQKVAYHFGNSALTYRNKAQLQLETGQLLINALQENLRADIKSRCARDAIKWGLDLGCGPGLFQPQLNSLPGELISFDLSKPMLNTNPALNNKVCGDSHSLPIQTNSIDWVFSNLMVQWCDFDTVITEVDRVLKPGGTAVISTLLPGSLYELEAAWAHVDSDRHIHQYQKSNDIEQSLLRLSAADIQSCQYELVYWYTDAMSLAKELKSLGANIVSNRGQKGLIGKRKWQLMEHHYRDLFANKGTNLVPATYRVKTIVINK
ncbi:methyltransferase domain-containing protein [Psychrosphaera aestuarii]|uniref:methyltransferase domain-containing protein n=1 Tax=Psychrosphaera aestuarii TaxID=1266052 RepID=UPI001B33BFF9|nr:methyltransferase domain-containing protein [Psychrosphaera aestuarii]